MARAIANCTCEKCGREFTKMKHELRNRDEANSWEQWATNYYTTCDECSRKEYNEQEEQKLKDNGFTIIRVSYSDYKNKYNDCKKVADSYDSNTKTIEIYVKQEMLEEKEEVQTKNEDEVEIDFNTMFEGIKLSSIHLFVDYLICYGDEEQYRTKPIKARIFQDLYIINKSTLKTIVESFNEEEVSNANEAQKDMLIALVNKLLDICNNNVAKEEVKKEVKEEPKEEIVEFEIDYTLYKKYCQQYKKVNESYNSKTHTIKIQVTQSQIDKINKTIEEHKDDYHEEVVLYKDYVDKYHKYKAYDFDNKKGTIKVLLPKDVEYVRNARDKHYEEKYAFKHGVIDELVIVPQTIDASTINVEVPECLKN